MSATGDGVHLATQEAQIQLCVSDCIRTGAHACRCRHLSDCSMASCSAMKAVVDPGIDCSSGYTNVLCRHVCHIRRQLRALKPSRYSPACTNTSIDQKAVADRMLITSGAEEHLA
jgi:hypothetical protein